ncbi:FdhF/YdeP family oxidoreductase [Actinocorallia cavernae]|uniref:FdhF/YdeP family oxidoreductase n=2 Tax=Actinomycetes TaxID=1760 RepID=A0ABP5Y151_9ACTN
MVYDPGTDHYVPITWKDAFELFGRVVRGLDDPNQASYYTSGRLGNEATFLYQLMAPELGTNNLPDCSNMCHKASGRALQASLGTGRGTADLKDWETAAALFIMGVNAASNAPRMLTALAEAYRRGARIVHINPLVEAAANRTIVPHGFLDMALLRGMAKAVLEQSGTDPKALDREFVDRHTTGFVEYRALCENTSWAELERQSGLRRADIVKAARVYCDVDRRIFSWCLGVSQHEHGVDTAREIVNLLLRRGNLGREGAGPSPRTRAQQCPGEPHLRHRPPAHRRVPGAPRRRLRDRSAAPDTPYTYAALRSCELTVQVSTKLNRSHLVHGRQALILPCLGRTEKDRQRRGLQSTSAEDSMSMVHLSVGMKRPASRHLLSEPAVIAGLARAALPGSATPWEWYVEDYDRIRNTMAQVLVSFEDFNRRVRLPLGLRIKQPARELVFHTPTGSAEISTAPLPDVVPAAGSLVLGTMRSHDQWNTTIYSDDDRYRGVKNLRTLVFMNEDDMRERGIAEFGRVDITATARDGSTRSLDGYLAIPYDIPRGCAAGYMPEMNVLSAIGDYSTQSDQPLMKHINVAITAA